MHFSPRPELEFAAKRRRGTPYLQSQRFLIGFDKVHENSIVIAGNPDSRKETCMCALG